MFWKRLPVTHAVGLWLLVAAAAVGAVLGYRSMFADLRQGEVQAKPGVSVTPAAVIPEQVPSLFGTIVSVDGNLLAIDSKQPFTQILIDAHTTVTSVGGEKRAASDLAAGAVITATGKDLGDGKMGAAAIVIMNQAGGGTVAPKQSDSYSFVQSWKGLPVVAAWNSRQEDPIVAVRELDWGQMGIDTEAGETAVSYLLFDRDGAIAERIEIDLPGLRRRKTLNPYLKPEEAQAEIAKRGFTIAPVMHGTGNDSKVTLPSGTVLEVLAPDLVACKGFFFVTGTKRIEVLPLKNGSCAGTPSGEHIYGSFALSPDGRYIFLASGIEYGEGTNLTYHLIDLKKIGIE